MKKANGLFVLVLALATIAGGLIFWRLFLYQPPVPAETLIPAPIPTQIILPSPTIAQEGKGESPTDLFRSLQEKFPLATFLPYENENFSVDYLAPLSLKVEIKIAAQAVQIKKEVEDWIWSKGVNPATHKISWTIPAP